MLRIHGREDLAHSLVTKYLYTVLGKAELYAVIYSRLLMTVHWGWAWLSARQEKSGAQFWACHPCDICTTPGADFRHRVHLSRTAVHSMVKCYGSDLAESQIIDTSFSWIMNSSHLLRYPIANEPRVAFADAMHDTTLKDSCELKWRQNASRKLDLNDMLSRGRLSALTPNFEIKKQSIIHTYSYPSE